MFSTNNFAKYDKLHLWWTMKFGANLCNSLLHRNNILLISKQGFCTKWLVQNEKDYILTLKLTLSIWSNVWNGGPSLTHLPKLFKAVSKQYISQTTIESSKLGTMYIFWDKKNWSSIIFSKFKNLTILVISLSQNWTKKEANLYTKFQLW